MPPETLFYLLIAGVITGIGVVAFLVYTGKISWSKAAMLFAGLGSGLVVLWVGWKAGRHQKTGNSQRPIPDLPPEPTTPTVAKAEVVKDTEGEIGKIVEAETDPDEIARLKKLAEGASQ